MHIYLPDHVRAVSGYAFYPRKNIWTVFTFGVNICHCYIYRKFLTFELVEKLIFLRSICPSYHGLYAACAAISFSVCGDRIYWTYLPLKSSYSFWYLKGCTISPWLSFHWHSVEYCFPVIIWVDICLQYFISYSFKIRQTHFIRNGDPYTEHSCIQYI